MLRECLLQCLTMFYKRLTLVYPSTLSPAIRIALMDTHTPMRIPIEDQLDELLQWSLWHAFHLGERFAGTLGRANLTQP